MNKSNWVEEFPGAVTVCDSEGIILAMNRRSIETFKDDGGEELIGSNALDCHPEAARRKMQGMLRNGQKNVYTIETGGIKKLIYQSPWYDGGVYAGFVELSLEIPFEMPHFVRTPAE